MSKKINLDQEVLGLNRRNQEYVRPYNPQSAKKIADSKIITKRILSKVGIKTPEVYKIIRTKKQLEFLDWESLPKSFVLKPNRGSGGNGIIVFYGKKKGKPEWIRPKGNTMTKNLIKLHIENILEGRYTISGRPDIAIIEERVKTHSDIKQFAYRGVPDIRVIVFNKIPIMAMTRLPTKRSDGTANLHSGAICVGIDIASGVTTSGMYMNPNPFLEDTYLFTEKTLDLDRNLQVSGFKIPFWNEILEISVKCQEASGLGYLGVDIALDQEKGPVVFEINARPGLGIQVANLQGLRTRLERVKGLKVKGTKHGIRVAKNLFGGEVEEEIENISGKTVVNLVERIVLYHKEIDQTYFKKKKKRKYEVVKGMLDTGVLTSRIDQTMAARLGYLNAWKHFKSHEVPTKFEDTDTAKQFIEKNEEEIVKHEDIKRLAIALENGQTKVRPVIENLVKIADEVKSIEMIVTDLKSTSYPVLIGRRELENYLIDTSKTFNK
jgi:alpha-L-glutamate ligase-like protein